MGNWVPCVYNTVEMQKKKKTKKKRNNFFEKDSEENEVFNLFMVYL